MHCRTTASASSDMDNISLCIAISHLAYFFGIGREIYTVIETRPLLVIPKDLHVCSSFASGCMALPVLMNIKQVIEQRQCSGVWTHKDELPVSPLLLIFSLPSISIFHFISKT